VVEEKIAFCQKYLSDLHISESAAFRVFFVRHSWWLRPYGAYCVTKDLASLSIGSTVKPAEFSEELLRIIEKDYPARIRFYWVIQFLCYQQLFKVTEYARSVGMLLLVDLPVLPGEIDAWSISRTNDDCLDSFMFDPSWVWWKSRLRSLEMYFDAVYLEHLIAHIIKVSDHLFETSDLFDPKTFSDSDSIQAEVLRGFLSVISSCAGRWAFGVFNTHLQLTPVFRLVC
jgi:hypothetical protein